MIVKAVAAAAAACLIATGALADPVGRYAVRGTNPNGSSYSGEVRVTRTGESTYRVVWDIGRRSYFGTAIGNDEFIAVSYRTGNQTGIALYSRKSGGRWEGVWTFAGGREVGTDNWSPRD
jgi:hypothetical protein